MYDYLVVGAGLAGSVFAFKAKAAGKRVLVIDKRGHIGGNCYTENICGINMHKYGAHIFHTSNESVWKFINGFCEFNNFVNSPLASYKDKLYNLPFNMNTFYQMWGVKTPCEARKIIEAQVEQAAIKTPQNLEEQALSLVGRDIYERLVKGYSEKQWGDKAANLPAFIIKRLPLRFTFNNNYFNDKYQGIPVGGYTQIFEKLLCGIEVRLNTDFIKKRNSLTLLAKKIVYTGMIDEYFDYRLGRLDYRSLRFESKIIAEENFQGNAVINYTDQKIPYTRIIEHKHFEGTTAKNTVVTYEYPKKHICGDEPYYPVNNEKNNALYNKYAELAKKETNTIFCGRLGGYVYLDMDKIIEKALCLSEQEFN